MRITSIALVLLVSVHCHTGAYNLASDVNYYNDRLRDYNAFCHTKTGHPPEICHEYYKALDAYWVEIQKTGSALRLGGNIAPEYAHVKESRKQLEKLEHAIPPAPATNSSLTGRPSRNQPAVQREWRDDRKTRSRIGCTT